MLVTNVYRSTKSFPEAEKFGLTTQMRRAAVSIPSNIAEGHMRNSDKQFKQFISIARGSCSELETQCEIAHNLEFLSDDAFNKMNDQIVEVAKMLSSFHAKL
jgi:four helix bundle protein